MQTGSPHTPRSPSYTSFARLYDRLLGDPMFPLVRRNFEWLVKRYNILFRSAADVACGTGTFLQYLSQPGRLTFGVDRSPSMLRIAARKNQRNGAMFLLQDLRELRLPCRVDLITCHFDSLNYLLSVRHLAQALRRFHENLASGGHAIFDMVTDFAAEPALGVNVQLFRLPGAWSIWSIVWDFERGLRSVTMRNFFALGNGTHATQEERHVQRPYPVAAVLRLAVVCGFRVRGAHDAFSLAPANARTYRAVYVARRP